MPLSTNVLHVVLIGLVVSPGSNQAVNQTLPATLVFMHSASLHFCIKTSSTFNAGYLSVKWQMKMNPKEHEKNIVVGRMVKLSCPDKDDEYGIVISTWHDKELDCKDCYVAFWGKDIPDFETAEKVKPYILRYAAISLQSVS